MKLKLFSFGALLAALVILSGVTMNSTGDQAVAQEGDPIATVNAFIESQMKAGKINKDNKRWRTILPEFPDLTYAADKDYYWNLNTNHGDVKLKFWPDVAPRHVANFMYLTQLGYFDGLSFHRVIPGFMAQGGCPDGNGRGSPGYKFAGEFDYYVEHDTPGLLSMANAGPRTDGSQFFITFVVTPWLNGNHTVFGKVTSGMETLKELEKRGTPRSGAPKEPMNIVKATITVEDSKGYPDRFTPEQMAQKFLEGKKVDLSGAKKTDSGMWIIDVVEGSGENPKPTDTVRAHYSGWFVNGEKFDSSRDRGQPSDFGLNRVIAGWTEGVGGMKPGGKRWLVIPYPIAYKEGGKKDPRTGRQVIPGHATLIFEVELLAVNP